MGAKGKVLKGSKNKKNTGPTNDSLVPVPPGDEAVPEDKKDFDKKNADGVRSGGILDLDTGFYVAPPADAIYDPKTQTYEIPAEFGGVNAITGEYIPPDGLKLDPLLGLVPLLGMGPDFKERDVDKTIAKFKNLQGGLTIVSRLCACLKNWAALMCTPTSTIASPPTPWKIIMESGVLCNALL